MTKPFDTEAEFDAWFKHMLEGWREVAGMVLKMDKEHNPILLVYSMDDQMRSFPIPDLKTVRDKDVLTMVHTRIALNPAVKAAVTVIEAWTLLQSADLDLDKVDTSKSIAEGPRRQECIMFNAISRSWQRLAMCLIKRPDNTLDDPIITDTRMATGRMVLDPEERGETKQ